MGAKHLSKRGNWQRGARIIGDKGENDIVSALASELPDHYEIHLKPPKLKVYPAGRGIALDALITNKESGKKLFLEKKTGNNGGNAHERVYKFLSPSLQKKVSGVLVRPTHQVLIYYLYLLRSGFFLLLFLSPVCLSMKALNIFLV